MTTTLPTVTAAATPTAAIGVIGGGKPQPASNAAAAASR